MDLKYVRDEVVSWTTVVCRRKKSARSEESESDGNLNVKD